MAERLHFALLCILYFLEFLLISYIYSNMRKYKSLILFTFRQSTINNRKKTTRHDYKNIKKKKEKYCQLLCVNRHFSFLVFATASNRTTSSCMTCTVRILYACQLPIHTYINMMNCVLCGWKWQKCCVLYCICSDKNVFVENTYLLVRHKSEGWDEENNEHARAHTYRRP